MYNSSAMANLLNVKCSQTSAATLIKTLLDLEVDSIFGYPGASILSIYNELSKTDKIKHFLVRHEQAAIHAAEGYARSSGKTGVVLVTSGPGFTNTITGIANAYADSTPLVVLAGDVAGKGRSGKIFQNVDIEAIASSCCKKVFVLQEKDDIKNVIKSAFYEAEHGVKGPVVVALPRNILEAKYLESNQKTSPQPTEENNFIQHNKELSELLQNSKKPLILVGGGSAEASMVIELLATRLQCPIVSTLMGIGIYPSENELYLGMIGINGTKYANNALKNCDLLICLGTSLSERSTCKNRDFAKNAKIVNINIMPSHKKFNLEIISDAKVFLSQFLKNIQIFLNNEKWLEEINISRNENIKEQCDSDILHSSFVLKTISEYTKYFEPTVVTDVGQHQMLTAQFFNFNKPYKFITSGGLGTMGFGLPASIGAHIAKPDSLVLNITGDGSFQMNSQELATCREHNIPIKIIILNNSYLGMVRQLQEKIYNNRYQVEMINPDFVKIAEAYDLFAIRVTKKDELIPALEKIIHHSGTAILDIVIDSFENI